MLAELTDELATREAEFAGLGGEFAHFRISYLRRFGPLYADLDRLDAEIARILADRLPDAHPEAVAARVRAVLKRIKG